MIFGHVYTIHFKIITIAFCVLISLNSAFAYSLESAKNDAISKYNALNKKIESCSAFKNRKIEIQDKWLLSQDLLIQKNILMELNQKANKNCSNIEEKEYILASFKLASYGESRPLNEYVELNKVDVKYSQKREKVLQNIPKSELERLSSLEQFKLPFNVLYAVDSIIN